MFLPKLKPDAKEKAAMRAFAAENKQGALLMAPSVCNHTNYMSNVEVGMLRGLNNRATGVTTLTLNSCA